jgi:hypothetical protein
VQPVDHLRVVAAAERPALLEVLERRVVDRDDDHVGGRLLLAANPEARVDRLVLQHGCRLERRLDRVPARSEIERKREHH